MSGLCDLIPTDKLEFSVPICIQPEPDDELVLSQDQLRIVSQHLKLCTHFDPGPRTPVQNDWDSDEESSDKELQYYEELYYTYFLDEDDVDVRGTKYAYCARTVRKDFLTTMYVLLLPLPFSFNSGTELTTFSIYLLRPHTTGSLSFRGYLTHVSPICEGTFDYSLFSQLLSDMHGPFRHVTLEGKDSYVRASCSLFLKVRGSFCKAFQDCPIYSKVIFYGAMWVCSFIEDVRSFIFRSLMDRRLKSIALQTPF